MTQTASNYGTVLFELGVKKEIVEKTKEIFSLTEELPKMLQSPIVSKEAKHRLIEDIFPEEIRNFLKVVSDHQEMDLMDDIFVAYKKAYDENHGILCAEMSYVMEPDAKQVEQMKAYLANKYGKQTVELGTLTTSDVKRMKVARSGSNFSFDTPFYKKSKVEDQYNALTVDLGKMAVQFRAYDDGAAYRIMTRMGKPFMRLLSLKWI